MAAEPLLRALSRMRAHLLDDQVLVRAVASGPPERGQEPRWKRVELRYVDLKAGRHLQVTAYDETQAHTSNHAVGDAARRRGGRPARRAVRELARRDHHRAAPGAGHQEARGDGAHQRPREAEVEVDARPRPRQGPAAARGRPGAGRRSGISDQQGRIKPSRQAKYRQVEEFLRLLDASITEALEKGQLRTPTAEDPLRVVDLGCGNAYLTFAAQRYLSVRGLPVHRHRRGRQGAVARPQRGGGRRARHRAPRSWSARSPTPRSTTAPEVVLALHACDTATDDALARAVGWEAPAGARRPLLPPRHRRPAARARRRPRRTPCSPATASCASGSPTPSPTRCAPRCCGCRATGSTWSSSSGASTPRATPCCGRCAPAARSRAAAPQASTTTWSRPGASAPAGRAARPLSGLACSVHDGRRAVAALAALRRRGDPQTGRWVQVPGPRIVESSALVVADGLVGHHQRLRRRRQGLRRRPDRGAPSGTTRRGLRRRRGDGAGRDRATSGWATSVTTRRSRDVAVRRVPVGRGDRTWGPSVPARVPRRRARRRDPAGATRAPAGCTS